MANSVLTVVTWFVLTFVIGAGLIGLLAIGVVASHSFTNEPQQFYEIGNGFMFEFADGDPVLIKVSRVEYNDVLDELWIHIQVLNIDDDIYVDSPYQFKVKDENNKVFAPIVKDLNYEIDEIATGELLATTLAYKIDDPNLEHTLIINEYFGNGAVGIELFK